MSIRRRTLAAALCLAGVAVALTPSPAAAISQWSFSDSLENSAWEVAGGDGGFAFLQTGGAAHSGNRYAWLRSEGGWGGVGRPLTLPSNILNRMGCKVSWFVRPLEPVTRVNIEVIDPDSWNYVYLRTVTLTAPAEGYRPYEWVSPPGSFIPAESNVYIRISAIGTSSGGSDANVDDVKLQCTGR